MGHGWDGSNHSTSVMGEGAGVRNPCVVEIRSNVLAPHYVKQWLPWVIPLF